MNDQIVLLYCLNGGCEHNLKDLGAANCNLKRVLLNEHGQCQDFIPRDEKKIDKGKISDDRQINP